jgi:hypothetical protein
VTHPAKLLGEKIPHTSELLDNDPVRLSKLLGENRKMNAKVSFGEVEASQFLRTWTRISRVDNRLRRGMSHGKEGERPRGTGKRKEG